jgi:16S rRNA (uracil1498-N3)-methyltransferase
MPRLFVPPEHLSGSHAILDAAAHRHLIKVLRLRAGAEVRVFDGRGTEIDARIESVERATVRISLGERRRVPPPACAITLLVVPPRGERMDFIVQKTTELGVGRILPVSSARGMVKAGAHQAQRWQTIAQEAARQSGRADVPTIAEPQDLAAALAETGAGGELRLLLWEGEHAQSLPRALASGPRAVALLVGPEGGFAADEAAQVVAAGFTAVGLGPRILRSETAAVVAVALAQAAAGGLEEE